MSTEPAEETKLVSFVPPERGYAPPEGQSIARETSNLNLSEEFWTKPASRRLWLFQRASRTAMAAAVAAVVIEVFAIVLGVQQHFIFATGLAWLSIALSAGAIVVALYSLVRRTRRRLALAALVIGVFGNPLVLVWLLGWLGN